METVHYTFTAWNDGAMASGFDGPVTGTRHTAVVREPERKSCPLGVDNVIDLAAWRAANLNMAEPPEEPDWAAGQEDEGAEASGFAVPAPRIRKSRRAALVAELVSTACVAAVTLVIILRVLAF